MPPNADGPRGEATPHKGRSSSASVATTATTRNAMVAEPVVMTVAYRPARRRSRWLGIVEECPACGEAHVHFGSPYGPPSGRRVAGCGLAYKVWPVFGGQSSAEDAAVGE